MSKTGGGTVEFFVYDRLYLLMLLSNQPVAIGVGICLHGSSGCSGVQ